MIGSEEALLEIGAVARRLGVCPATVRNRERAGRFPTGIRLPSGRRVWRLSTLEQHEARLALQVDHKTGAGRPRP